MIVHDDRPPLHLLVHGGMFWFVEIGETVTTFWLGRVVWKPRVIA